MKSSVDCVCTGKVAVKALNMAVSTFSRGLSTATSRATGLPRRLIRAVSPDPYIVGVGDLSLTDAIAGLGPAINRLD
jgi:hypothetical protein